MSMPVPVLGTLIVVGLIIGVVYVIGLTKKWGILVPFAGMLLFASMSLPLTWDDRINPTVWLPIQQIRSQLFLASGVAGLIVIAFQSERFRGKKQSLSVWALVLAGFYAAMLRFVHEGPSEGVFSVIFSFCTLIPLMATAMMVIDEIHDFPLLLRTVAFVNTIWIFMVLVQVAVNPKYITMGNEFRFVGILANPQHTGALMAFLCVIVLWLLLNDRRKFRIFYLALLGINGLFLLWTGSRTGLGMAIIGVSAVLYTKAGRAILLLPLVAIITYVGLKVMIGVMGVDFGFERLASTANTRDYAWWKLYTTGMENPLFGVGTLESEKSENSWLFGFAAFGIGMLALTVIFAFLAAWESLRLVRTRFWLPTYLRSYPDLIVGFIAMYFAGAVLEGYIISRVSAALCLFPIIAGAGAMIRKFAYEYHEYGYEEHDPYEYSLKSDNEYDPDLQRAYSDQPEIT